MNLRILTLSAVLPFLMACETDLSLDVYVDETSEDTVPPAENPAAEPPEDTEVVVVIEPPAEVEPVDQNDDPTDDPAEEPVAPELLLDACDDPLFENSAWLSYTSGPFTLRYLAGTPAESDLSDISAARQAAYTNIASALALTAAPKLEIWLSPSRLAAWWHGLGMGWSYPGYDSAEVVYTGAPGSYEKTHVGHEITHLLAYYADPGEHLPILEEGLAELLDQSGRDLHAAYAAQLTAGIESRGHLTSFDDNDVWGMNYGRAGSLAQVLVELYGMNGLLAVRKATRLDWDLGCLGREDLGCVEDVESMTAVLDDALRQTLDVTLSDVAAAWRVRIDQALAHVAKLDAEDEAEVLALLAAMDDATNRDDAALMRKTIDGFYCDWLDEDGRVELATRQATASAGVRTELVAVYPVNTENFTSAQAVVLRHEERGAVSALWVALEKFPVGWRVTWSSDW